MPPGRMILLFHRVTRQERQVIFEVTAKVQKHIGKIEQRCLSVWIKF
jgi:hypothetical protein